jgi:hypothetical protein
MLKIHEFTSADGRLSALFLRFDGGVLEIVADDGAFPLAPDELGRVMAHFGTPFDPDEPVAPVAALALDGGRTLSHVRHLAGYDVIARDYLVYATPTAEPLCAMAAIVATALGHVARSCG